MLLPVPEHMMNNYDVEASGNDFSLVSRVQNRFDAPLPKTISKRWGEVGVKALQSPFAIISTALGRLISCFLPPDTLLHNKHIFKIYFAFFTSSNVARAEQLNKHIKQFCKASERAISIPGNKNRWCVQCKVV